MAAPLRDEFGRFARAVPNTVILAVPEAPIVKPAKPTTAEEALPLLRKKLAQSGGSYYAFGVARENGDWYSSTGPCFAQLAGRNAHFTGPDVKYFAENQFRQQAWNASAGGRTADETYKVQAKTYLHFLMNDSCFAPCFITKDVNEAWELGTVMDAKNFSAQYLITAGMAIRMITEYTNIVKTWFQLSNEMDGNQALYFAHMFAYSEGMNGGVFMPTVYSGGHYWFDYRQHRNQFRLMVDKKVDPLGGNGVPFNQSCNYGGLAALFGKIPPPYAPNSYSINPDRKGLFDIDKFPAGQGVKVKNSLGMIGTGSGGGYTVKDIVPAVEKWIKENKLYEIG